MRTISELKELQRLVVNRRALRLDLLTSPSLLESIRPDLIKLVASLPSNSFPTTPEQQASVHPIIDKLVKRYNLHQEEFPWYVGVVIPSEPTGNSTFYGDFVDYSQTDRTSLVRLLSSEILAGRGPWSAYMKSRESGLAYNLSMRGDPSRGLIIYYADRTLDIPSLMSSASAAVEDITNIKDPYLVDYALRQAFPASPRSSYTFSTREQLLTQDIHDGNTPEKVRSFYEALLRTRHEPNLLTEITHAGNDSLCRVLLKEECTTQQKAGHSIFFFVGPEKILSDAERRIPIQNLLRVWPSDYWIP
jgi:hypothetical protein